MEKVSDPSLPSYFHQKIHNKKCPKAMDWLRPIPPPSPLRKNSIENQHLVTRSLPLD